MVLLWNTNMQQYCKYNTLKNLLSSYSPEGVNDSEVIFGLTSVLTGIFNEQK